MPARITEFPSDNHLWRLDWIGRLIYVAGRKANEPLVKVYLSRLRDDYVRALNNSSPVQPEETVSAEVGVGQLPLLIIGTVWRNGVQQAPHQPAEERLIVLDHTMFELKRFDGWTRFDGQEIPVLPPNRYRVGRSKFHEIAGSWIAVAKLPDERQRLVLIPSVVLFQKCLATSPKAIQRLLTGGLHHIIDASSGMVEGEESTCYVNLFKDFKDTEAPALANLVADPVARAEYNRMRRVLVEQSANFDLSPNANRPDTHIKLSLPFSNDVQMQVRGKPFPIAQPRAGEDTIWGFLVCEIVNLYVRLFFQRLILDRKNSGKQGENAGDADLSVAFDTAPKQPSEAMEPEQPLASGTDSDTDIAKLSLEACGGIEPWDLTIVTEEKTVQKYRAAPKHDADWGQPFEGLASTSEPSGTGADLVQADLDVAPTPQEPVTINQFLEALELANRQGLALHTIAVAGLHRTAKQFKHHVVNFMRRIIPNVRSWHLAEGNDPRRTRGYVVVELQRGDAWHYLIELERKGNGAALALAHIHQQSGARLAPTELEQFMVAVAQSNGWSAMEHYDHWTYDPIEHTANRGGAPALARKIMATFKHTPQALATAPTRIAPDSSVQPTGTSVTAASLSDPSLEPGPSA